LDLKNPCWSANTHATNLSKLGVSNSPTGSVLLLWELICYAFCRYALHYVGDKQAIKESSPLEQQQNQHWSQENSKRNDAGQFRTMVPQHALHSNEVQVCNCKQVCNVHSRWAVPDPPTQIHEDVSKSFRTDRLDSENCNWYSSLPIGVIVSLFCESV